MLLFYFLTIVHYLECSIGISSKCANKGNYYYYYYYIEAIFNHIIIYHFSCSFNWLQQGVAELWMGFILLYLYLD